MFSTKITILILISYNLIEKSNSLHKLGTISNQFECLIGSTKYMYEYLSGSNDRYISVDNLIKKRNHRVYSIHQLSLKNVSILKWILIQNNNANDKYYLKHKRSNEYLCAADLMDESGRRSVYSANIRNDQLKIYMDKMNMKCLWKLERTLSENGFNTYIIRNVYFNNETLFPAIAKSTKYKRNVYLWNKVPSNDKYKWIIDC